MDTIIKNEVETPTRRDGYGLPDRITATPPLPLRHRPAPHSPIWTRAGFHLGLAALTLAAGLLWSQKARRATSKSVAQLEACDPDETGGVLFAILLPPMPIRQVVWYRFRIHPPPERK
ncbi:MAG: hypothetical protein EHM70_17910 [Chloroflexota bacterium]|nr:MAG: hypothetical protein EHM70_17910 [Chloroflexota bacterium]